MEFRTKIKELCAKRGISQVELARKLGITDISLNKTLRGEYPKLQTLERIAIALEVPISELFINEEDKTDADNSLTCPHCGQKIKISLG